MNYVHSASAAHHFRPLCIPSLLATAVAFAALLVAPPAARADLEAQPACEHSKLIAYSGPDIRDDEFAELLKKILLKNGTNSAVRDAKFLFQECYGGGMIDDIQAGLSNKVKWVAGSAAKHNEWAWGYDDERGGTWTDALKDELAKKDQSLKDGIDKANDNDTLGAKSEKPLEHGQSATGGGGETITLGDTNALSHHAVLWGGDADSPRHFTNMEKIFNALTNAWGMPRPNVSLCVMFGDGLHQSDGKTALPAAWNAMAATKSNLTACLCALTNVLTTNEQFFFYATDHGGWEKDANKAVTAVAPGSTVTLPVSIIEDILQHARRAVENIPYISFEYSGGPAIATFNGQFLTTLNPGNSFQLLSIPENQLTPLNTIAIQNSGPGDLLLRRVTLSVGGFDTPRPLLHQVEIVQPNYNRTNSQFSFSMSGEAGLDFTIESTLNFQTWTRGAGGIFQAGQTVTFVAPAPPSSPRRFYRLISTNGMLHATAANHGRVQPPGPIFLPIPNPLSFIALPEPGYEVDTWSVNGLPAQPGGMNFNATAQPADQFIQVTFRPLGLQ